MRPSFVFVGLGNPGSSYQNTRHNIGFLAAECVRSAFCTEGWQDKQKFLSFLADGKIGETPILVMKPTTYMNRSGEAIKKIVDFYGLDTRSQILVCSDEIDLPLGTFRFKLSGGPGTHNGLKSIVDVFGEEFPRLRIGIGPEPKDQDLASWVLSRLTQEECEKLAPVLDEVPNIVRTHVETIAK